MEQSKKIRILVADDHPVVREGLVAIMNSQPDMEVVAEAGNGKETIDAFEKHHPDVTLMDLLMPESSGLEATTEIMQKFPGARILVLTTYHGDEDIYRALKAGARGYLLKGTPRAELVDAIRAVHAGQKRIPPEIAARLADRIPASELTPREMDVLKLIVKGQSNKEIANSLQISEGTVKGYVNIILTKMGVSDRTQAATSALQRGIVHID